MGKKRKGYSRKDRNEYKKRQKTKEEDVKKKECKAEERSKGDEEDKEEGSLGTNKQDEQNYRDNETLQKCNGLKKIDKIYKEVAVEEKRKKTKMSSKVFCMALGYVGNDFHGFQKQVGPQNVECVYTVESELENVLKKVDIMKKCDSLKDIKWSKAARTDKGVHAACQTVGLRISLPIIHHEETHNDEENLCCNNLHSTNGNEDETEITRKKNELYSKLQAKEGIEEKEKQKEGKKNCEEEIERREKEKKNIDQENETAETKITKEGATAGEGEKEEREEEINSKEKEEIKENHEANEKEEMNEEEEEKKRRLLKEKKEKEEKEDRKGGKEEEEKNGLRNEKEVSEIHRTNGEVSTKNIHVEEEEKKEEKKEEEKKEKYDKEGHDGNEACSTAHQASVAEGIKFLVREINAILPTSIRIFNIYRASRMFDARVSCSKRCYEYLLPTYVLKKLGEEFLQNISHIHRCRLRSRNGSVLPSSSSNLISESPSSSCPPSLDTVISCAAAKCLEEVVVSPDEEKVPPSSSSPSSISLHANNTNVLLNENNENGKYSKRNESYGSGCTQHEINEHNLKLEEDSQTFGEKELAEFEDILKKYEGTKNYYNFTSKIPASDPAAFRYIQHLDASIYEMHGIKYVRVRLVGQSFLLNQIRKMIGLAVEIYNGTAPMKAMEECLDASGGKKYIHMAPGEGLLLSHVLYDSYNSLRAQPPITPFLTFEDITEQIDHFKQNFIYKEIHQAEHRGVWRNWLLRDVYMHPYFLCNDQTFNTTTDS